MSVLTMKKIQTPQVSNQYEQQSNQTPQVSDQYPQQSNQVNTAPLKVFDFFTAEVLLMNSDSTAIKSNSSTINPIRTD